MEEDHVVATGARNAFKLVDRRDVVLGTVTVPGGWADSLRRLGFVRFVIAPPLALRCLVEDPTPIAADVRVGVLQRAIGRRDAVELWGVSLEELERLPGCAFSPSAAYLRSVIG